MSARAVILGVRNFYFYIAIYSFLVFGFAHHGHAQSTIHFDIPRKSLEQALLDYGEAAGVAIVFDKTITADRTSEGASGELTPEQALRQLLSGTGITYRFTGANSVRLERAVSEESNGPLRLNQITVTGERVERTVFDTASSVQVIGAEELESRHGDTRLTDVIEDVPNVSYIGVGTAPTIRGQDMRGPNDGAAAFFGGTAPRASYIVDGRAGNFLELVETSVSVFDVERVEVFRGPQTTSQGANSIAGAIHVVTKDPTFEPEYLLEGERGNFDHARVAGVASGAIVEDQLAGRIAYEYQSADSYADASAGFDPGPSSLDSHLYSGRAKLLLQPAALPEFEVKLTVNYVDSNRPGDIVVNEPVDALITDFTGLINTSYENTIFSTLLDASHEISDGVRISNQFQYAKTDLNRITSDGVNGDAENTGREFVDELRLDVRTPDETITGLVGVRLGHVDSDEFLDFNGTTTFSDEKTNIGIFGELSYRLSETLTILGGLRYQRDTVKRDGVAAFGIGALSFEETYDALLPRVSVSQEVTPDFTVGALISRGYNPGGVALSFTRADFVEYDPEFVWNYELFARSELLNGRAFINGNLFYATLEDAQRNTQTPIPGTNNNDRFTINAEKARSFGMELAVDVLVTDRLSLSGAVGLLATEFREFSDASTDFVGNEFANAPTYSLTAGARWEAIEGLVLGARVSHTDGVSSDDENTETLKTDPVTIVDLDFAYETGGSLSMFGYLNNVFDQIEPLQAFETGTAAVTTPREFGVGLRLKL